MNDSSGPVGQRPSPGAPPSPEAAKGHRSGRETVLGLGSGGAGRGSRRDASDSRRSACCCSGPSGSRSSGILRGVGPEGGARGAAGYRSPTSCLGRAHVTGRFSAPWSVVGFLWAPKPAEPGRIPAGAVFHLRRRARCSRSSRGRRRTTGSHARKRQGKRHYECGWQTCIDGKTRPASRSPANHATVFQPDDEADCSASPAHSQAGGAKPEGRAT